MQFEIRGPDDAAVVIAKRVLFQDEADKLDPADVIHLANTVLRFAEAMPKLEQLAQQLREHSGAVSVHVQ